MHDILFAFNVSLVKGQRMLEIVLKRTSMAELVQVGVCRC